MELIVITPESDIDAETDIATAMFASGNHFRLHIRKPLYGTQDYISYISRIDSRYRDRLVIHGAFELMEAWGLGGIHLNETAKKNARMQHQIRHLPKGVVSASFHSWQAIADNEFPYAYVFISPMFDSISKPGYEAAIDLGGATKTRLELEGKMRYCPRLIGLGGVGLHQIPVLQHHGFDGAAVLGSIWQHGDPYQSFLDIVNATQSAGH